MIIFHSGSPPQFRTQVVSRIRNYKNRSRKSHSHANFDTKSQSIDSPSQIPNNLQIQHTQQSPQSEIQQSLKLTPFHAVPNSNPKPRFDTKPPNPTCTQIISTRKNPQKPQNPSSNSQHLDHTPPQFTPKPKASASKTRNQTGQNEKETHSARSPSWRRTPTRPAMATPSSRASGSSLSAALYSSGSAKLYSFRIWYLVNGIFLQIQNPSSQIYAFPRSLERRDFARAWGI
jgi:hypothetical protein